MQIPAVLIKYWGIVAVAIALSIILLFGFWGIILNTIAFIISYFATYPLILFILITAVVAASAVYTKQLKFAILAFGIALILVAADFWLPPTSATCISPVAQEGLAFIQNYPLQAFAADTLFCKTWLTMTNNFNPIFFTFDFGGIALITIFQAILVVLIMAALLIAIKFSRAFWSTVFTFILLLLIVSGLYDGEAINAVPITLLLIVAYGIIPAILVVVGSLITGYAALKR